MKNIYMMAAICITAIGCNHFAVPSNTPVTNVELQNDQGKVILAGHCSISSLQSNPYKEWFDKSYNEYKIDTSSAEMIKLLLQNKTIEIFLGSWCGDSKREVPRMLKVLQSVNFDTADIQLIFVDNSVKKYKQSPQHEEAGKNIFRVPTFVVYNKKREIGRIIESPVVSLEKDLLAILKQENYTPNYKAVVYWQQNMKHKIHSLADETLQQFASLVKPLCRHTSEFNSYGYVLLAKENYAEALNILRLNTFIYPDNEATYNNLGDAYMTVGNKEEAKKNYQKVLQLKPDDDNAKKMLRQL